MTFQEYYFSEEPMNESKDMYVIPFSDGVGSREIKCKVVGNFLIHRPNWKFGEGSSGWRITHEPTRRMVFGQLTFDSVNHARKFCKEMVTKADFGVGEYSKIESQMPPEEFSDIIRTAIENSGHKPLKRTNFA